LAIHRGPCEVPAADRAALLALHGAWRLQVGGEETALEEGELAVVEGGPAGMRAAGTGVLAVAAVTLR
jgi:hypothetical protein